MLRTDKCYIFYNYFIFIFTLISKAGGGRNLDVSVAFAGCCQAYARHAKPSASAPGAADQE
jgi:hypothetical protein